MREVWGSFILDNKQPQKKKKIKHYILTQNLKTCVKLIYMNVRLNADDPNKCGEQKVSTTN